MSRKEYISDRMYKASTGIANAVLVTLGIGLLFESIGGYLGWEVLLAIGGAAKVLLAPALGAGIAYQLGGNSLIIFSAMASSAVCSCSVKCSPAIAIVHCPPSCTHYCNARCSNDQASRVKIDKMEYTERWR